MSPNATELGTVRDAARWGRNALLPSETASLDAQLLLAHVLDKPRTWIFAHPVQAVTEEEQEAYARLIRRRQSGEPVAYLRGHVEWMGLELDVTPDVLVPRPETELVLERALVLARERGATVLADVGTGSGAIAIALALAEPDNRVYATDSSEAALSVARRNIEKHGVAGRVHLLAGNLLAPVAERPALIVANLPYLSDEMMATVDQDVLHEPVLALHGGSTGLEPYRELFRQMVEREWMIPAVLEIDPRQAGEMRMLAREFFCGGHVEVERDYAGHDRIAVIEP